MVLDDERDTGRVIVIESDGTRTFLDFAAYRGNETPDIDWCRTIESVELTTLQDGYQITYKGDGFLYKMVRLMTGTIVRCAQGMMDPRTIEELLARKGERKTSFAAPPDGLFHVGVLY